MHKNKVYISNDLKNDLKSYAANYSVGMASQIRDDIYEEAKRAIDLFYGSYSPVKYKRHKYNFKKNSFKKYYTNPHNQIIRGGIELTPDELDNIYKSVYGQNSVVKYENSVSSTGITGANLTSYIFNLVYSGYHGNVGMFNHVTSIPPVMSPSPLEILLNKRDDIIKNIDSYQQYGIARANKGLYTTIR